MCIRDRDIAGRLEWVCTQENVTIDHDAAMLIAVTADGGMRDALSILDQCIGRSDGHVTYGPVSYTHLKKVLDWLPLNRTGAGINSGNVK